MWSRIPADGSGWTSVLGWQTGLASLAFLVGTMIQGLLVLDNDTYVFERWHGTLLVIAITAFCIIFNTFLAKKLPMVEGLVLIIHLLGFFAVLIPLWVLAPRNSPKVVFTEFSNLGEWDSKGLSFMVGLLAPIYTLIGADSAVHMSEEIKDASIVLPKAIMWAATINGSLGFVMIITFCFTLGSVFDILETPTGYPFIQVFYNVTQSKAGTSIMTAIIIVNITSACISTVATVSRQTWSFARDKGLPFSSFISHVSLTNLRVQKCQPHNRKSTDIVFPGQARMEHPLECSPPHLRHHYSPLSNQHWIYSCFQRYRFSSGLRHSRHIHHLIRLPDSPSSSKGTHATTSMVTRRCWNIHQYRSCMFPPGSLGIRILPNRQECYC